MTHLATKDHVAAGTQNLALNAIVFLYKQVIHKELGKFADIQWAKRPQRLPVVLTRQEVKIILAQLHGRARP